MPDYRSSKIEFVSGATGSTVVHVNSISLVVLSSIAFYSALRRSYPLSFVLEWTVLVLPLLLAITLFANSPWILFLCILAPTIVILVSIPSRQSGTPLPSSQPPSRPSSPIPSDRSNPIPIAPLPALTTYRAHMMLMTILSILAVDFPVFPRSLAKCETYGVSLMDMGVGSFVFSQGIVSAIPILKDPTYLAASTTSKALPVVRKVLPVAFLGIVRVLLVKGTEYPEHESEYGTHWNFFITLALLPLLQVFLHPLISRMPVSMLGVLVALAQQIALSLLGMEDFVLHSPRTNLVRANKEGIVSLPGYLAIHLLGLSIGTLILPSSPSYFRRRQRAKRRDSDPHSPSGGFTPKARQNDKTAIELVSYATIWWTLFGMTRFVGIDAGVSRKMVNLSYIFWVAAFNVSFILGYLLLDMYFCQSQTPGPDRPSTKLSVPTNSLDGTPVSRPPALLDAINKNGLALFLIANVITGLINLSIQTMYTTDAFGMLVLCAYSFVICSIAWTCRHWRIWML